MIQLTGIHRIVFNGVAGADHFGMFQTRNRCDHRFLNVCGHAGGHAVHVNLVGIEAFRLQKDLMGFLIGEFYELILNRRAIAGADTLDLAAVKR